MKRSYNSNIYARYFIAILLFAAFTACTQEEELEETLTEEDEEFVIEAGYALEILRRMTNLASSQASNEVVKFYARQTAPEISTIQLELQRIAYLKGITCPDEPRPQMQLFYQELAGMLDEEFDVAYLGKLIDTYGDLKENYQNYVNNGNNSTLQNYALKNIPITVKRLERAQELKKVLSYR